MDPDAMKDMAEAQKRMQAGDWAGGYVPVSVSDNGMRRTALITVPWQILKHARHGGRFTCAGSGTRW